MITFTSIADLDQLADDDPAKPVIRQLLEWLIAPGDFTNQPYNPDGHCIRDLPLPIPLLVSMP